MKGWSSGSVAAVDGFKDVWKQGKLAGSNSLAHYHWVVVSNIFYFHPYLGKIPILTNIFQRGWNHQVDHFLELPCSWNSVVLLGKDFWSLAKPSFLNSFFSKDPSPPPMETPDPPNDTQKEGLKTDDNLTPKMTSQGFLGWMKPLRHFGIASSPPGSSGC